VVYSKTRVATHFDPVTYLQLAARSEHSVWVGQLLDPPHSVALSPHSRRTNGGHVAVVSSISLFTRSIRLELDRSLKSEEQILAEWEQRIERKRETVNRTKPNCTILEKKPSQIGDAPASGPALVKTGDKDKVPGLMELIRAVLESEKEGTHRGRNQNFGRKRR